MTDFSRKRAFRLDRATSVSYFHVKVLFASLSSLPSHLTDRSGALSFERRFRPDYTITEVVPNEAEHRSKVQLLL